MDRKTKAEGSEPVDVRSILVHARGETHRVGKVQSHDTDRDARHSAAKQGLGAEPRQDIEALEGEGVCRFRVEGKEQRPDGAIEHAGILARRAETSLLRLPALRAAVAARCRR